MVLRQRLKSEHSNNFHTEPPHLARYAKNVVGPLSKMGLEIKGGGTKHAHSNILMTEVQMSSFMNICQRTQKRYT
jgi:hypothetical protein